MSANSKRWLVGFALFALGGVIVLFPLMFAAASSHPSLIGNITGLSIGTILGGPIAASGVALMYGRNKYASYAFLIAGIEYSAIELYDGYAGGTPIFLVLGLVFLAVGFVIGYRNRGRNANTSGESNADNLTAIGVVIIGLGILAAILASGSVNTSILAYLTSLSILLLGSIVTGAGRVLARWQ